MVRLTRIEKPKKSHLVSKAAIALLVVGLVAAGGYFILSRKAPSAPEEPFQVQNYIGSVKVKSKGSHGWKDTNRGSQITLGDKIMTEKGSELDLRLGERVRLRLKEGSLLEIRKPGPFDQETAYHLNLKRGKLLLAIDKKTPGEYFIVDTKDLSVGMERGSLEAEAFPKEKKYWVGVLRGKADLLSSRSGKAGQISELQKVESSKESPTEEPVKISREEWNQMKEVYELIQRTAAMEAAQLDLAKQAGNLFDYVFDHGTFYTPNLGYALREFIKDPGSGKVSLEIEYDVFPDGSFVGMYIKTRKLDMYHFSKLKMDIKKVPDYGFPENVKMELKTKSGVARAFAIKVHGSDWQTVEFPLNFRKSTPIEELTFVFANDRVGEYKKGKIQFRNITLVPADRKAEANNVPVNATALPAKPQTSTQEVPKVSLKQAETPEASATAKTDENLSGLSIGELSDLLEKESSGNVN